MLEVEYLNCEIDNGHFVLAFDFPTKIGSRRLSSIDKGDMHEYVKNFKQAVEIRGFIQVDLAFMIMLSKKERHQVVMALGIDNTLRSLTSTCIKYAEENEKLLGFLYNKSLDFYFLDIVKEIGAKRNVAIAEGNLVEATKLENAMKVCDNIFTYVDKQLDKSNEDYKELCYRDISIFEYDSNNLLTGNDEEI